MCSRYELPRNAAEKPPPIVWPITVRERQLTADFTDLMKIQNSDFSTPSRTPRTCLPSAGNSGGHKACCRGPSLCSSACKCWVLHEKLQNKQKASKHKAKQLLFHSSCSKGKSQVSNITLVLTHGSHSGTSFRLTAYSPCIFLSSPPEHLSSNYKHLLESLMSPQKQLMYPLHRNQFPLFTRRILTSTTYRFLKKGQPLACQMGEQTGTPLVKNLGSKTVRTALEFYKSASTNHTQFKNPGEPAVSTSAGKSSSQVKQLWQDIVFET